MASDRLQALEDELAEAKAALEAIRLGDVDALVIQGETGPRVVSVAAANEAFRSLVDSFGADAAPFDQVLGVAPDPSKSSAGSKARSPSPPRLTPLGPRLAWATVAVAVVIAALPYSALPHRITVGISDVVQAAAAATASLACFLAARQRPPHFRAWLLLGLACASWTAGQIAWTYYEVVAHQEVPIASVADIGFLGYVPLAFAAILLLSPLPRLRGLGRVGLVLDGLLASGTVILAMWAVRLESLAVDEGLGLRTLLLLAYPFTDLLLVATAGVVMLRTHSSWSSNLPILGLGMFLIGVADLGFALGMFGSGFTSGGWVDAAWAAGFLIIGLAACSPRTLDTAVPIASPDVPALRFLPLLAILVVALATFLHSQAHTAVGVGDFALFSFVAVAAASRQVVLSLEGGRLERDKATTSEELTKSNRHLQSALQNIAVMQAATHTGTWAYDYANETLTASAEVYRLIETKPGHRLGAEDLFGMVDAGDRQRFKDTLAQSIERHTAWVVDGRLARSTEGTKFIENLGHHLYDPDGKVVRTIGTTQDITERKRAELAIREAENRFSRAANATQDIIWEWDPSTNQSFHSDQLAKYGHDPAKFKDSLDLFMSCIHPDDLERFSGAVQELLEGTATRFAGEYRFRRADGTYADVLDQAVIERDAAGKAIRLVGAMTDVTERNRARRELEHAHRHSEQAEAAAHLGAWHYDVATKTMQWSKEAYAVWGVDPSVQPSIATVMSLLQPEDRATAAAKLQALFADNGGTQDSNDYRIVRPDGALRVLHGETRVERDAAGKTTQLWGSVQDITERLAAESKAREAETQRLRADALEQVDRDRVTLMNAMAHELNNPLTPIKLQLAVLKAPGTGPLVEAQEKSLEIMERNVDRVARLATDLLDLSRIQAGKLKMRLAPADAARICRDVLATYGPTAKAAGVELTASGPPSCPLQADEGRIVQTLVNLVSNAVKFTPSGGLARISYAPVGEHVELAVHDTGLGLTPQQIEGLFRPFSQVQGPTQALKGGMGLGLYISKGIVEAHGGTIRVESEGPGHGSTFTVSLPAKIRPGPPASPEQHLQPKPPHAWVAA